MSSCATGWKASPTMTWAGTRCEALSGVAPKKRRLEFFETPFLFSRRIPPSGGGALGGGDGFDFDFAREGGGGDGSGDFQNAVAVFRGDFVGVNAFGKFDGAMERAIADFAVDVVGFL